MPSYLITPEFSLNTLKEFIKSVDGSSVNNNYYAFASRSLSYPNGDDTVPDPSNNPKEYYYDSYKQMVFGKKIANTDVKSTIKRYDWVSNTIYDMYDNNIDLTRKQYYVVVNSTSTSELYVFKVLYNNDGLPSTVPPSKADTNADEPYYSTSDGYEWKYMYTITRNDYDKFASKNFVPVTPDANVVGNSIPGAIDVIKVSYKGSRYDTFLANTFSAQQITVGGNTVLYEIANNASPNNDFYVDSVVTIVDGTGKGQSKQIIDYYIDSSKKLIVIESAFSTRPDVTSHYEITPSVIIKGDGADAKARALVNATSSNSIYKIEILDRGNDYNYAYATVVGNTGGTSNTAVLVPIISPSGGHGSDAETELQAKHVSISFTFANTEADTIPTTNDYRTIGIIKDPKFANVELTLTGIDGNFVLGEQVFEIIPKDLQGKVSISTVANTLNANASNPVDLDRAFKVGDYVYVSNGSSHYIDTVVVVTNSSQIQLSGNGGFACTAANAHAVEIKARGYIRAIEASSILVGNVEGTCAATNNQLVVGKVSGTVAEVSDVKVNGVTKGFSTFDQRSKLTISSNSIQGSFTQDEIIYQTDQATSNGYVHTFANNALNVNSYIYATDLQGTITPGSENLIGNTSGGTALVLDVLPPDLVPFTGKILYTENLEFIQRSNSQSETYKLIVEF